MLEKEPVKARPAVQQQMQHWQKDSDFAGVCGDARVKLPEAERRQWQKLWAEVEPFRNLLPDNVVVGALGAHPAWLASHPATASAPWGRVLPEILILS
jgi:hypothetical protein